MKTRSLIFLSAVGSIGAALHWQAPVIATILAVGHVLMFQLHVLEVKINRLLSDRGIFIADSELD